MSVEKIGRYQISGELGKGAMGVVYKATDPTIGRTVALKTMRVDVHGEDHEDMLRRLQNEARAAGLLSHPNIVTIYDAGEDDGIFYIAMEYIEGESLAGLLTKKRSLSAQETVEIGNQICAGLQYAHTKKVVHRDIKPANIMLANGGNVVKITDFGIAKAGASLTHTGEVVGTPHYMSPEQIKGRMLDGRSDLFSTGVLLYEMITGEKPFNGPAVTTVIYKIVNETPIPPREMDVTIHPGLSMVISKCLAKDPDDRYQDAADLSTALRSYKILSIPEPRPAPPSSPRPRPTERVQTRPIAPPAGNSSTSSIRLKKVAAPKPAPVEVPVREEPNANGRGGGKGIVVALALLAIAAMWYFRPKSAETASNTPVASVSTSTPVLPKTDRPSTERVPPPAEVTETPAPATDEASAAVEKLPTAASVGDLRITSNPSGAQVTIDGVSQDWYVTPFNTPPIKAGTHTITASAPGLVAQTRTIEVAARKKTIVDFQLAGDNAIYNISSNPVGADITIDGQATGARTPAQFALGAGSHRITLHLEGFETEDLVAQSTTGVEVNVGPTLRARNSVNISAQAQQFNPQGLGPFAKIRRALASGDLPEGMGAVHIRTRPKGASVIVDNQQLERRTPFRLPVRAGTYTVTISKGGFRPITRIVEVEEGKLLEINEMLLPQR